MYYRVDLEHVTDSHIEVESYNERKTKKAAYNLAKRLSNSKQFHDLDGSLNIYGEKAHARVWVQEVFDMHDAGYNGGILTAIFKKGVKVYETVG